MALPKKKRPLKDVLEEFETKVIAAASKLQEQLANNAEQPDAPAAAAQSAIDARRRKRDAEVGDVLTPSQPPTDDDGAVLKKLKGNGDRDSSH